MLSKKSVLFIVEFHQSQKYFEIAVEQKGSFWAGTNMDNPCMIKSGMCMIQKPCTVIQTAVSASS